MEVENIQLQKRNRPRRDPVPESLLHSVCVRFLMDLINKTILYFGTVYLDVFVKQLPHIG